MNNTPQKPAIGISEQRVDDDFKSYKIPCSCGCDNNVDFFIEVDEYSISATVCSTTKTNYWRERVAVKYTEHWIILNSKLLFNDVYNRLAICGQALFKGYIQTESCVILSEQQALNFAETIKSAAAEFDIIVKVRMAKHVAEKAAEKAAAKKTKAARTKSE